MSEQLIETPCDFGENGNILLERELGQGGMGGVYMGRDKMLDRPVAVKVMLPEYGTDAEFVDKFRREAQAVAKLMHPNIAQIYSFGVCNDMPYIVMELVSGGSLYSIMESSKGKADVTRVMKIGQQVALALQCASDQGFVHGDVKPENILLDANGNAKLVDFGLAAMQKETDEIWGTPYYISPEKVRKEAIDFRADMYSLGGTLYHALTGVAPFEGDDAIEVVKKRFQENPKKLSAIRPEITPAIDSLILKMLAREKENRFPSFEALLEEFKKVLSSGLTNKLPEIATGKRIIMRKKSHTAAMTAPLPNVDDIPEMPAEGGAPAEPAATDASAEEDEEEGGNLGLKIALFIVGGLLLVGAVIGGLFWFKASSAKAEQAAIQQQIDAGFAKAREAIADTVKKAEGFSTDFNALVTKALEDVDGIAEELAKYLSEEEKAKSMTEIAKRANLLSTTLTKVAEQNKALAEKAKAESEAIAGTDQASMEKLADLSRQLVDLYDQMKGSSEVEEARKAVSLIRDSGKRLIETAKKNESVAKLQAQRKAAAEAKAAAEKAQKDKADAERKAKIDGEIASIVTKYAALVKQGTLHQLDFENALNQLDSVATALETPEGQIAAKREIRKVENLQKMQKVLIRNLPGYTFKKGKLKGRTVKSADAKGITFTKGGSLEWSRLVREENYASVREVYGYFIYNGRKNARLSKMDWADAMTGAAMAMQMIHADPTGAKRLIDQVAREFPDYINTLKDIFPDVALDANAADDEEEDE